mgnify:CR=1 FL=1
MPYPARTTVLCSGFQARPSRGAKLFRSGRTSVTGKLPLYGPVSPTPHGPGGAAKAGGHSRSTQRLGREGSEQVTPDLNLNPYGARDKGVSRVHAALRRDRSQVLLIDLGSTNGTRLNGKTLAAHQPIRVENGDEIRLGRLMLTINFVP